MRQGKLTYADIATLRAAAPRGLWKFGKAWASSFAGPRFHAGPITSLVRAGYLEKNDDSEETHLVVTRKGRDVLARVAPVEQRLLRDIAAAVGEQERLAS